VFDDGGAGHVRLGTEADLVVVAPATADLIARIAAGLADDLLTATLLATAAPVVLFPSMHTQMWCSAATRANVATLRARGVEVTEPASGPLAGTDAGPGRMVEPEDIAAWVLDRLSSGAHGPVAGSRAPGRECLAGRRVVVSAGGTREPIDPVRYVANRSSGRQGIAVAEAARACGAEVRLVAANVTLAAPADVERVDVETAGELHDAMVRAAQWADIVVMAAAVADFTPADPASDKIPRRGREDMTLRLIPTPDVLADLIAARPAGQVVVGFAAETGDGAGGALARGQTKARAKGADLTVVNDVSGGRGFATPDNAVWILDRAGNVVGSASGPKLAVAEAIMSAVVSVIGRNGNAAVTRAGAPDG
jgi:phosphopantothenoylcysteine decarboxylase/phosphopantothenate--cysteine ligase